MDLPDRLRQSWADNADAWARVVQGGAIASREVGTDAAVVEAVVRGLPPAGRVLDLGCGEGWLCRALAALGVETYGVDASERLVEIARLAGGAFDVVDYDAAGADPARLGGPYDVAVFNFSLLSDRAVGILRAAASRLDEGGRVVVQTAHPASLALPYREGWREESFASLGDDFEPMPWYARTFGAWARSLRAAGLRLTEVEEPTDPESGAPLSLLMTAEPG